MSIQTSFINSDNDVFAREDFSTDDLFNTDVLFDTDALFEQREKCIKLSQLTCIFTNGLNIMPIGHNVIDEAMSDDETMSDVFDEISSLGKKIATWYKYRSFFDTFTEYPEFDGVNDFICNSINEAKKIRNVATFRDNHNKMIEALKMSFNKEQYEKMHLLPNFDFENILANKNSTLRKNKKRLRTY